MRTTQIMEAFGCNFIHKRLIGGGLGFITGGPGGAVSGFFAPKQEETALADARTQGGCQAGMIRNQQGDCVRAPGGFPRPPFGGGNGNGAAQQFAPAMPQQDFGDGFGGAVMGRFGAALVPATVPATRLRCPRGAVLGKDNLCYDHIHKKDRKWNPGTKPLLTGGEMRIMRKAQALETRLKNLGVPCGVSKKRKTRKLLR